MEISEELLNDIKQGKLSLDNLRSETYKTIKEVEIISEPVTYEYFFRNYLLPNRPCLLDTWATDSWLSREKWKTDENAIDLEYLDKHFGEAKVPVANCNVEQYSSHPKEDMLMADYVKHLKKLSSSSHEKDNHGSNQTPAPEDKCLYLKDWHFTREFPDYKAYQVPVFFCSDWLNESWDTPEDLSDDYRFVYIGPKGSWTPFHTDVFKSNSWSANIVGCKKWIFFPPGEETQFKDKLGNLAYDLTSDDLQDEVKFSHAFQGHQGFEVIQREGQVLFVPSGWHHQVWNLDTISINHNWYNGCNIDLCWAYIKSCLRDVQREIDDCRDMVGWHQQCQLVLKASCGMDFSDFLQFLQLIADHRISFLSRNHATNDSSENMDNRKGVPECLCYVKSENACTVSKQKYYNAYGKNHALFDLNGITLIMRDFVETVKDYDELDFTKCARHPEDFLKWLLDFEQQEGYLSRPNKS